MLGVTRNVYKIASLVHEEIVINTGKRSTTIRICVFLFVFFFLLGKYNFKNLGWVDMTATS